VENGEIPVAREQRKLAAILAADVVGYSRLMGRDESGTLARLRKNRSEHLDPVLTKYGGRLVKLTGDGALVEFGSAVDALSAAIEFQQAMADANRDRPLDTALVFRIGLHLGDLIVDADDLYGDGVNIAARLEGEARPGGIVISRAVREAVQGRLKVNLVALGELALKNIERPIRAFRVEWEEADWRQTAPVPVKASESAPLKEAALEKSGAPRLSIVVLPFANIGGGADLEYFVDGVTESLTTDLSRMSGMLVIGCNTAFTYKGKHVDLKQLGHELGVRYVLEGAVQRGGDRMRVNAQLIDAATGIHLWAERFDKPLTELFDMQDEIVARLAGQLDTQLITAEARRAERAPNPDSMDLYFQGMAWRAKGFTPEFLSRASSYFERALALDSGNIEALVWKANLDTQKASLYPTDDRAAQLAAAEAALTKALSLAPEHAFAHVALGFVQVQTKRAVQGIAECERALALDRNLAAAHALIGFAKSHIGRAEETEAHIRETLRLSPRDTFAYLWMGVGGVAKLLLGRDEEAAKRFYRVLEINRNYPRAYFWLAAALAHLHRLDEAQSMVRAGLALDPTFTVRRFNAAALSDNPIYLAQRGRVTEGMRKAGVPE
jgi:TolB-like protein/class 3 adenylate cyclase/Tfp pilus assembly protein PilF